jgi:hypothetical protein
MDFLLLIVYGNQSETFCEEYSKFSKLWLLNLLSHLKLQLNKTRIFQCLGKFREEIVSLQLSEIFGTGK